MGHGSRPILPRKTTSEDTPEDTAMKLLLVLLACVAAVTAKSVIDKRAAHTDFPRNACPFGRNDEMECCQPSGEYTEDDGSVKQCCIDTVVNCAKKLLQGQKSVHWGGKPLVEETRKKRGAPTAAMMRWSAANRAESTLKMTAA